MFKPGEIGQPRLAVAHGSHAAGIVAGLRLLGKFTKAVSTVSRLGAMTRMKSRWDQGRLATLLNVGTLIRPTTLAEYQSSDRVRFPLPFGLFSHNDQQSVWQSSAPEGATSGWGGRLADIALSSNTNTIFTAISAAGNSVFLTGQSAIAYQVSGSGAIKLRSGNTRVAGSTTAYNMMREIMTQPDPSPHIFEGEYNRVVKRSIDSEGVYSAGVNGATLNTNSRCAATI